MKLQNIYDEETLLWYLWKEAYSHFGIFEYREGFNVTREMVRENGDLLRDEILKYFGYDVYTFNINKKRRKYHEIEV